MRTEITAKEWLDSQAKEARFWERQAKEGNIEQFHRWGWYSQVCFPDWFGGRSFTGKRVADIGSGPEGILHYIGEAELKLAVDPLMDVYEDQYGVDTISENGVTAESEYAEYLSGVLKRYGTFDVVFCLNCLDHCRDPQKCVKELASLLRDDGELALCVDMREEQDLDDMHKIRITSETMLQMLSNAGLKCKWWIVPHQAPTRTVQFCAIARRA
jgi:2-polyprenyl-3-methyl-5-hydroxy-6-metoxy-1,4-benzoquinol methylase